MRSINLSKPSAKAFSGVRRHNPSGKRSAPKLSCNSTAAARCLRGGKRPGRRHRAWGASPVRSRVVFVSSVAGLPVDPQRFSERSSAPSSHNIVTPCQPLPSLCFRRSSRAPWSPLLASLSNSGCSSAPSAHRPLVPRFARDRWWGRRSLGLWRRLGAGNTSGTHVLR